MVPCYHSVYICIRLDVWASYNGALTWVQQTAAARWSNRDATSTWFYNSPYLRYTPILTLFGGDALSGSILDNNVTLPDRLNNETWVSSDFGQTWTLLAYYPFAMRDHSSQGTQVSAQGVVVITSGKISESVTQYINGQETHTDTDTYTRYTCTYINIDTSRRQSD